MELDPRKSRILTCVVESYIRTGEPIGSKMIAAMLEETVSSATVRNDLAYLSEQGYIEQPHTSAGRIPTHRGLRYYLDHLMKPQPLEDAARGEIDALFNYCDPDPDRVLEGATRMLAKETGCFAISTAVSSAISIILVNVVWRSAAESSSPVTSDAISARDATRQLPERSTSVPW